MLMTQARFRESKDFNWTEIYVKLSNNYNKLYLYPARKYHNYNERTDKRRSGEKGVTALNEREVNEVAEMEDEHKAT